MFKLKTQVDKKWSLECKIVNDTEYMKWIEVLETTIALCSPVIFGTTIFDAAVKSNAVVPDIITSTIAEIRKKLDMEGLFRLSGKKTDIDKCKKLYDRGEAPDFTNCDVHLCTGLLKQYIRGLSQSLIPYKHFPEFVKSVDANTEQLKALCSKLNPINYKVLAYLMTVRPLFRSPRPEAVVIG